MSRMTINQLLTRSRASLDRFTPEEAHTATKNGAILIDTRCAEVLEQDGEIPGAFHVPLSVLYWRLDPASRSRDIRLADPNALVVLLCDHGYSSSLAAVTLRQLGFEHATDVIGEFQAWRDSGLPVMEASPL